MQLSQFLFLPLVSTLQFLFLHLELFIHLLQMSFHSILLLLEPPLVFLYLNYFSGNHLVVSNNSTMFLLQFFVIQVQPRKTLLGDFPVLVIWKYIYWLINVLPLFNIPQSKRLWKWAEKSLKKNCKSFYIRTNLIQCMNFPVSHNWIFHCPFFVLFWLLNNVIL